MRTLAFHGLLLVALLLSSDIITHTNAIRVHQRMMQASIDANPSTALSGPTSSQSVLSTDNQALLNSLNIKEEKRNLERLQQLHSRATALLPSHLKDSDLSLQSLLEQHMETGAVTILTILLISAIVTLVVAVAATGVSLTVWGITAHSRWEAENFQAHIYKTKMDFCARTHSILAEFDLLQLLVGTRPHDPDLKALRLTIATARKKAEAMSEVACSNLSDKKMQAMLHESIDEQDAAIKEVKADIASTITAAAQVILMVITMGTAAHAGHAASAVHQAAGAPYTHTTRLIHGGAHNFGSHVHSSGASHLQTTLKKLHLPYSKKSLETFVAHTAERKLILGAGDLIAGAITTNETAAGFLKAITIRNFQMSYSELKDLIATKFSTIIDSALHHLFQSMKIGSAALDFFTKEIVHMVQVLLMHGDKVVAAFKSTYKNLLEVLKVLYNDGELKWPSWKDVQPKLKKFLEDNTSFEAIGNLIGGIVVSLLPFLKSIGRFFFRLSKLASEIGRADRVQLMGGSYELEARMNSMYSMCTFDSSMVELFGEISGGLVDQADDLLRKEEDAATSESTSNSDAIDTSEENVSEDTSFSSLLSMSVGKDSSNGPNISDDSEDGDDKDASSQTGRSNTSDNSNNVDGSHEGSESGGESDGLKQTTAVDVVEDMCTVSPQVCLRFSELANTRSPQQAFLVNHGMITQVALTVGQDSHEDLIAGGFSIVEPSITFGSKYETPNRQVHLWFKRGGLSAKYAISNIYVAEEKAEKKSPQCGSKESDESDSCWVQIPLNVNQFGKYRYEIWYERSKVSDSTQVVTDIRTTAENGPPLDTYHQNYPIGHFTKQAGYNFAEGSEMMNYKSWGQYVRLFVQKLTRQELKQNMTSFVNGHWEEDACSGPINEIVVLPPQQSEPSPHLSPFRPSSVTVHALSWGNVNSDYLVLNRNSTKTYVQNFVQLDTKTVPKDHSLLGDGIVDKEGKYIAIKYTTDSSKAVVDVYVENPTYVDLGKPTSERSLPPHVLTGQWMEAFTTGGKYGGNIVWVKHVTREQVDDIADVKTAGGEKMLRNVLTSKLMMLNTRFQNNVCARATEDEMGANPTVAHYFNQQRCIFDDDNSTLPTEAEGLDPITHLDTASILKCINDNTCTQFSRCNCNITMQRNATAEEAITNVFLDGSELKTVSMGTDYSPAIVDVFVQYYKAKYPPTEEYSIFPVDIGKINTWYRLYVVKDMSIGFKRRNICSE